MKIRDIVKYNGKDWKIIAIKGDWARIKKIDKGHIQKIIPVSELEEVIKWKMFLILNNLMNYITREIY